MNFFKTLGTGFLICVCSAFMILGAALITVGSLVLAHTKIYDSFAENGFFSVPAIIILVGIITLLVFFFGCMGAAKANSCVTIVFTSLMTIVLIIELAGVFAAYALRGNTEAFLEDSLNNSFYSMSNTTANIGIWDTIQKTEKCCGLKSAADYNTMNMTIPDSCCIKPKCDTSTAFQLGCSKAIKDTLMDNATLLLEWTAGVAAFQLIFIIIGFAMAKSFRRGGYETV